MPRVQCRPLPPIPDHIQIYIRSLIKIAPGEGSCHPWMGTRTKRGYPTIRIGNDIVYVTRIVHFMETGEDPYPFEMRHTCDNPPCCRFSHLLIGTHQQNMQDAVDRKRMAHGDDNGSRTHPERRAKGAANGSVRLTDNEAASARERYAAGQNCRAIAIDLGCSPSLIVKIVHGTLRKGVGGPIEAGPLSRATHKVPVNRHAEIFQMRSEGRTIREICERFEVTQGAIIPILYSDPRFAPKVQLSEALREEIRHKYASGETVKSLAHEYSRSINTIYDIVKR